MKFFILLFIPFLSFAQKPCKSAYIHENRILDSLPMPAHVKKTVDSMQSVYKSELVQKRKEIKAKYKDAKTAKKKIKSFEKEKRDSIVKIKYKMLNKIYGAKVREASMKIYDKGKKYESVFNADNQFFSKIPDDACDVTAECLNMVRESLK